MSLSISAFFISSIALFIFFFKSAISTDCVATISWILFQIPFLGNLVSVVFSLLGFGILLRAALVSVKKEEPAAPEIKE